MATIYTLGDSTLDNLFWMLKDQGNIDEAKKKSVEGVLQTLVQDRRINVVSCAYDGFTTESILNGDQIGRALKPCPTKDRYLEERTKEQSFVYPLKDLKEKIKANPDQTHFVVLSVGGNDFRVNLNHPFKLIFQIGQIQKRYLQILDQIQGIKGKKIHPILVFQYKTDANNDFYAIYSTFKGLGIIALAVYAATLGTFGLCLWFASSQMLFQGALSSLLGAGLFFLGKKIAPLSTLKMGFSKKGMGEAIFDRLIHAFYEPIVKKAKKEKIPILDLPNTFDPHKDLYECGIEPGEKGGELIAEGINHIVCNHSFEGPSYFYAQAPEENSYKGAVNQGPKTWEVV